MAASGVFSVRVPTALKRQIDDVAQAMERPRGWVVTRALEDFVRTNAWQVEEIRRAVAEADAGDFASPQEVEATFARWTRQA
jgi:predicted transcriptional regulator